MNSINNIEMDIRGQICPSCLLIALKEVTNNANSIRNKETTITIISDDRHTTTTIPDAVHSMGFLANVSKTGKGYEIVIFKE